MDPMQTQNQAPITEGKKSFGPVAGVVIIVILLILGAVYMMGGKDNASDTPQNTEQISSDEVSAIESELQADTELDIDLSELDSI
jgi:uncharacterized protein HemX